MTSPPQSEAQRWDPERYRRNAAFVPAYGAPLIAFLAPKAGERVLDLGCGEGALTVKLAECASVVGVDASPAQVEAARARGLDARVMDAAALAFDREFDAVFSNAALHWVKDLDAVFAGVHRALKPGGRFACEMGGEGNVATVRAALDRALRRRGIDPGAADPWRFLGEDEARMLLARAGFALPSMTLFARPTDLPGSLADWLDTFAGSFLSRLPEAEHGPLKDEITEYLKGRLSDSAGRWTVDYVRLRFLAVKPAS